MGAFRYTAGMTITQRFAAGGSGDNNGRAIASNRQCLCIPQQPQSFRHRNDLRLKERQQSVEGLFPERHATAENAFDESLDFTDGGGGSLSPF
ncbi:hypothetical protein J25TS5_19550 [Paenibacillus faecis]|uniref:hypothetical protein n=1 Tax=Paenibacillus faecis TaxID=862114 RepID=UPI001B2E7910|nr:hypothetical protein [Paenibacillus faecis]GIO85023.1 hypothetical protein J25TS5_19550 [Paenibacillus faecis]